MSSEAFDNGAITARGPVSGVTVHAHMRQGPHAVMDCPLDLVVITEIMFLLAEQGRRPADAEPLILTPLTLLDSLRSRGVRSANGQPIGKNAVYDSFGRLRDKDYLDLVEDRDERKVTGYRYDFYEFPAWNPNPTPLPGQEMSSQVGAGSGIAGSTNAGSRSVKRTSRMSSQVEAASGIAGTGYAGSRSAEHASSQAGAASGNGPTPPLPPGGGGGSSPYPLNDDAQAQQEEKAPSAEELAAAVGLLQELPDPWVIGDKDAKQIAPELLAQMQRKEWPSILDVDRQLLAIPLTANPGGMTNPVSILRHKRIPNLPTYSRVAARAAKKSSAPAEGKCPRHPAFVDGDCSPCRIAERERGQRGKSDPAGVDGAGLLARLRSGQTNS